MIGAVSAASDTSTEDIVNQDISIENNQNNHNDHENDVKVMEKTKKTTENNKINTNTNTNNLKKTEETQNTNTNNTNHQTTNTNNKLKTNNNNENLLKETQTTANNWTELKNKAEGSGDISIELNGDEYNATDTITIRSVSKVTIEGNGKTINGQKQYQIFKVNGELILKNLNLINGKSDDHGGAIYNNGKLTIINCTFNNNTVTEGSGGAIYANTGSTVNINNTTFTQNNANDDGGAIYADIDSTVNINNTTFTQNNANWYGGAIFAHQGSTVNINNTTFTQNNANWYGGAISNYGTVIIMGSELTDNTANYGGAIYNQYGTLTLVDSNLQNDGLSIFSSEYIDVVPIGGYIAFVTTRVFDISVLPAVDVDLVEIQLRGYSGEVWVNVTNSTFNQIVKVNLKDGEGSGTINLPIGNKYNATINTIQGHSINPQTQEFSTIHETSFTALYSNITNLQDDTLTLTHDYIYDNRTDTDFIHGIPINKTITINGNGHTINGNNTARIFKITNNAQVTITNITLTQGQGQNDGPNDYNVGGAIYVNNAKITIINCTLTQNTANRYGGAIYTQGSQLNITGNNITGNTATEYGVGGAITTINSQLNITGNNIIGNTATYHGGVIYTQGSQLNITGNNITGNNAYGGGAILTYESQLNITGNNITGNTATGEYGIGGAIYTSYSQLNITGNNITGNTATEYGGAIYTNYKDIVNIIGNLFMDNTANNDGSAIYGDDFDNLTVNGNIFLNKTGSQIIYLKKEFDGVFGYNLDCNWFGNNATDYNITTNKPKVESNVPDLKFDNWLFLKATNTTDQVTVFSTSNITFKLDLYNSTNTDNKVSDYDNKQLYPINLNITSSKGTVDKSIAHLNDTIVYNATMGGKGSVTASIGTVSYTVELTNNEIPTEITVNNNTLNLFVDGTFTIVATTTPEGLDVTFVPDESGVYSVDEKGVVTALKEGTAKITVKVGGDGIYAENTTIVTVKVSKIPTPQPQPTPEPTPASKQNTKIVAKNKVYKPAKYRTYKITVKNTKGKPVKNTKVKLKIGKKTYTRKTNKKGIATFKIPNKKSKKKTKKSKKTWKITATLNKNAKNDKLTLQRGSKTNTAKTNNNGIATFTIKTTKKKIRKYTITLKTTSGQIVKKQKVTLKVKGKTFKAKTNNKGKATFKINNLNKNGKYKTKITYKGNNQYNKSSKTVKITIKE